MRRIPALWLAVAALALGAVPVGLLVYFSIHLSSSALRHEVELRVASTDAVMATLVQGDADGVVQVVQGYALRPTLQAALDASKNLAAREPSLAVQLHELRLTRPDIAAAFLATPGGRVIAVDPVNPSLVGKDFSFRDWYRGVRRTGGPYVSRIYISQAAGHPRVVAAAVPVLGGPHGTEVAILVAAYRLGHIQSVVDGFFRNDGIRITITDQYGVLLAEPARQPGLPSRRDDPLVAAALAGRTGMRSVGGPNGAQLAAFRPIPGLGWTVSASVPASTALAKIGTLQGIVAAIAAILVVLLLLGATGFGRAWSRRMSAEAELVRLATINRAVLDAARDAITMEGPNGGLVFANARTRELGAELFGAPELALSDEEVAARLTDPGRYLEERRVERENPDAELVSEYELAASRHRFLRYSAPVNDEEGRRLGRIVTLRDVTAEREAEQLKVDLVATVSHELRTPLTGVLGFAELLQRPGLDEETRAEYAATIHSEATRLTEMINDFLDLQRFEAGALTLSLQSLDLRDLVRKAVAVFSRDGSKHQFELDLPDSPLPVAVDAKLIAQVLTNLLSNATKYSPAGGEIHVSASLGDGNVRVAVRDPGIGIPADQQRRLFTKFFRVDSTDTRSIGGTGLGLALVREIVGAHGGRIGVESVEGEGSTFWFELVHSARRAAARPRVLVVEDEPVAAEVIVAFLGDGFDVEVATTGAGALERTHHRAPSVICLDIGLPGDLTGWQVLASLQDDPNTSQVPVIVCTAAAGRSRAAALGAAGFLAKPFTREELLETVTRLLPEPRGGDVLVVDGDATVRMLVAANLDGEGHTIREAGDGEEALAAIGEHRPDAIVLDLVDGGFALFERLQADDELRSVPVVVLTARKPAPWELQALDARAVAVLEKRRYSAAELRRLVDQALGTGARDPEGATPAESAPRARP